jgi:hypothetical protein
VSKSKSESNAAIRVGDEQEEKDAKNEGKQVRCGTAVLREKTTTLMLPSQSRN